MKKIYLLLTLITSIQLNSNAQYCSPPSSSQELEINNVRALVHNGGDMFWDLLGTPRYEVPKGSGINALFAAGLWLGGLDSNDSLHLAAIRYRYNGNDFYPGPLNNSGTVDSNTCDLFNRVFAVTQDEIILHLVGDSTATSILEWPAKGNPNISLPNQDLAPFIDVNGDGLYNPDHGDYPKIKGVRSVWWVFNDAGNIHSETGGEAIGVEVQVMAYSYSTNDVLDNTTLFDYKVINKGENLHEFYLGQFVDPDLGNASDDFIGCDTVQGIGIAYNGDSYDEDNSGALGYGSNPPVMGVSAINKPILNNVSYSLSHFMYYNNNSTVMGTPNSPMQYYGYMKSLWKDNTHLKLGGSGFNANNTGTNANFIFPGEPNDPNSWNECTANNTPYDRRFVMSYGPMNFNLFDTITYTMAYVYSRESSNLAGCNQSFESIKTATAEVKQLSDSLADCSNFNPQFDTTVVYPTTNGSDGSISFDFQGDAPNIYWSTSTNTPSIDNLSNNSYTAVLYSGNCFQTYTFNLWPVGVDNLFSDKQIQISPNPNNGSFNIKHDFEEPINGIIYSLSGQEIYKATILSGVEEINLNVGAGTYILQMEYNGSIGHRKLVVAP